MPIQMEIRRLASILVVAAVAALPPHARAQSTRPASAPLPSGKTFIDYFLPTPIVGTLSKDVWGADKVLPRDNKNGLESADNKFCYWDGQIIKAADGKYHMFASRWDEANGHDGWRGSVAVHAVSDAVVGPYVDKGPMWPADMGGKGHNVTALTMADGAYAVIVSETRPGAVFTAKNPDGPWAMLGEIKVDAPRWRASNYSIILRPDGDYMIVPRGGQILISKDGICGPYRVAAPSVYPKGIPNLEDPVLFHTGGLYHIVVNSWSTRVAYHLTSVDGITNWTDHGLAYDPRKDILKYADGTVTHWDKAERPGVVIENGHVIAVSLAVLDVEKNQERGNDRHGSKVIVVPFDGEALDKDCASLTRPSTAPVEAK